MPNIPRSTAHLRCDGARSSNMRIMIPEDNTHNDRPVWESSLATEERVGQAEGLAVLPRDQTPDRLSIGGQGVASPPHRRQLDGHEIARFVLHQTVRVM